MKTETQKTQAEILLEKLAIAKRAEEEAKNNRVSLELAIHAIYAKELPEKGGTKTFTEGGFKFEIKSDFNFKTTEIDAVKSLAPQLIKTKEEISATEYKKLWDTQPTLATKISAYITATPSKPSVTIKEIL